MEIFGTLGRVEARDGMIALRLYPFDFSTDPKARPVLAVRFEDARFDAGALEPLREDEVEVAVFADRVEVHAVFAGTDTVLRAGAVTGEWVGYDAEDLFRRIDQIQASADELNARLVAAEQKNRQGEALVQELRRRAEIKAAASEALRAGQASALAVLDRLGRHFEGGE